MQVTLCNAKEEPFVIHDTEQSHATQKTQERSIRELMRLIRWSLIFIRIIRDMIRFRSIRHVLSALIR